MADRLVNPNNGQPLIIRPFRRRMKKLVRLIFIICFFAFIVYYTGVISTFRPSSETDEFTPTAQIPREYLLSCYHDESVQSAVKNLDEDLVEENESFFFIETKCHENYTFGLSPRQACSVESVARLNPKTNVYILVPSPVHRLSYSDHMRELLRSYKNIHIRHINVQDYLSGTPLENWGWESHLRKSTYQATHASDVLRYVTLWKFGGTYLDTDVILLRTFNRTNFAGAEAEDTVGSAVLSITKGHVINNMNLNDLFANFRGDDWSNNGPGVIKRSLMRLCGVEKPSQMTIDNCHSFEVLPAEVIYPVHWSDWELFFTQFDRVAKNTLNEIDGAITVHFWNYLSHQKESIVGSTQPYAVLASQNCPVVHATFDETF